MGRTYFENKKKLKAYLVQDTQSGAKKIYRMYLGSERIYPNAGMVTYHVDTNVTYTEEVDIDESCLSPKTFTPQKSGYTFHGWRKDDTASSSVLSSEIMTGEDVTLYAVFKKTITLSYNGNGNTGGSTASQSGTQYYNNGNAANPAFKLNANGFTRTNYGFVSWRMGSTSGTSYNAGDSVTLSSNTVFYASWKLSSVAIPSQIGDDNWQGAEYTGSSKTGPYDLTGVSSLVFTIYAKTREELTTGITVGVSSNGSSFTRSQYYGVNRNNPNCEAGWGGYFERFTLIVNVSGLTGNYYILHTAKIASYNWSRIESISVK